MPKGYQGIALFSGYAREVRRWVFALFNAGTSLFSLRDFKAGRSITTALFCGKTNIMKNMNKDNKITIILISLILLAFLGLWMLISIFNN